MFKTLLLVTSALILFGQENLTASDYRWPMKIAPELTSRFCDYRAGHFHAGLDIRTKGKTGYRVYAVNDGYINRITTSYNGYGKAVYLKLKDGRIAVYGHLLRFEKGLDDRVRKIQIKEKRYRQDLYFKPGEIPVKKGQVVGLSGASGAGAPHLHFEIRSADNRPLNPLKFGFGVIDKKPPVFDKLAIRVYPNKFGPGIPSYLEISNLIKNGNTYSLPETLYVDGHAVMAVSGGDKIDGKGFLYGFYSLRLFVDDSLIFSSVADSITYETTKQLDYIRDIEISRIVGSGKSKDNDENIFHKLYIPAGANQYFWIDRNMIGIIPPATAPGQIRTFEIVASDEAGNESRLKGLLAAAKLRVPDPEFISYYRFGDTLEIDFLTLDTIEVCDLQYRNNRGSKFKPIDCSLNSKTLNRGEAVAYLNTVRAVMSYNDMDYRLSFSDKNGDQSPWIYFGDGTGKSGLRLKGVPGHLRVEYYPDSIYTSLSIRIENQTRVIDSEMKQGGIQKYFFDIHEEEFEDVTNITIRNKSVVAIDTTLVLFPVGKGKRVRVISPDSVLTLIIDDNSVYYPTYVFPSAGKESKVLGVDAVVFDIEPSDLQA
ncbi:MAG: M23 family metallopeptidase, partial [candidate division Zixibacteria bacterium]